MKNLKLKPFLVAGIATIGSLNALASNPNSAPASGKPGNVWWAINNDLTGIKTDKNNITNLKEKLKNDCKAANKMAVITDRKELKKLRADLNRDEAYLMADRKESIRTYELAISKWRNTVREDKSRLTLSKKLMREDISKQNAGAIKTDAVLITENQQSLRNDRMKLNSEQKSLNADIAGINKGMREANVGWFVLFEKNKNPYAEGTYANK